jgi:hypothetical protein
VQPFADKYGLFLTNVNLKLFNRSSGEHIGYDIRGSYDDNNIFTSVQGARSGDYAFLHFLWMAK